MRKSDQSLKRYYTIGEVAKMFDVSPSLIRYWDTEFDSLRPHKNSKGDRRFTQKNIDQLKDIFHLVKERGFSLKGAKMELEKEKEKSKERSEVIKRLQALRVFLEEVKYKI